MRIVRSLKDNKYQILIFTILLVALILRFYHFENRWGLGTDDARDISIAKEALLRKEMPLIGSFSSAGPFVFGPLFYWFIMASYVVFPFTIVAPWIATVIVSILTVLVLIYCGRLIGGNKLSVIVGLLAATSPQLVVRSTVLGQHTFISITASLLLLFFLLFWQKKNVLFSFLMGLSLGTALSMHYQALNLLLFFPALLFVPMDLRKKITAVFFMLLGFLIPSLPLLIWDSRQSFANMRNMLDYLLIGQYRLYVPNSWRLFAFKHFPDYWTFVTGGYFFIGFSLMFLSGIFFIFSFIKKNLSRPLFILGMIFFILFIINRYYHGERSEGYLIYFSPLIIIFSAGVVDRLFALDTKFSKLGGLIFLFVILMGNLFNLNRLLIYDNNINEMRTGVQKISAKFPVKKFSVYDYALKSTYISLPLSVLLKEKDKTDKNGVAIGVACIKKECEKQNLPIIATVSGYPIVDLQGLKGLEKRKTKWINVNQESMYNDLIGWSKKNNLKSTFSFKNYIIQKVGFL